MGNGPFRIVETAGAQTVQSESFRKWKCLPGKGDRVSVLTRDHVIRGAMDQCVRPSLRVDAVSAELDRLIDVRVRGIPVAAKPQAAREVNRDLGSPVRISARVQLVERTLEQVDPGPVSGV